MRTIIQAVMAAETAAVTLMAAADATARRDAEGGREKARREAGLSTWP